MFERHVLDSDPLRKILHLLADGEVRSGRELGLLLGISRAAVWKQLQKLESVGVCLLSVKGKGYRLSKPLDLLDLETIIAQVRSSLPLKWSLFAGIDSTNSYLVRHDNPAMQICLAESQTAGRGRRGRTWVSPFAQNIYCSVGWSFEEGVSALEGLSLVVGLVVIKTLAKVGVTGLQLKWPNDVLYQERKLAGVLIEITGDPAGYCQAIIGIGLNVSMESNHQASIERPWIDLQDILKEQRLPVPSRNLLVATLVDEMIPVLTEYHQKGFSHYCAEWQSYDAFTGKRVELHNGNTIREGICEGVSNSGALLFRTALGVESVHGGEISLRRVDDT